MDLFFKDGVPDAYYLARRENTAVIGYACTSPCDQRAFCAAVGSLDHSEGADIFITPQAGGGVLVEVKTELGKKLAARSGMGSSRQARGCERSPVDTVRAALSRLRYLRSPKSWGKNFNSPVWGKACGSLLLVWHLQPGLPHLLLLRRCGRPESGCGVRKPHEDVGRMHAPFVRRGRGGTQFPSRCISAPASPGEPQIRIPAEKYGQGSVWVGCGRCGRQCTSHIDIYDIVSDLIQEGGR